ncbi:hypothetical protein [Sorangium sp. So ce131]|uniref:hypothetical protein n=1 Tax=Sorangium sp. So ce131 TaxID=3133282 RepID=UPI003F632440
MPVRRGAPADGGGDADGGGADCGGADCGGADCGAPLPAGGRAEPEPPRGWASGVGARVGPALGAEAPAAEGALGWDDGAAPADAGAAAGFPAGSPLLPAEGLASAVRA